MGVFRSFSTLSPSGSKIWVRVRFAHVGQGLAFKHGEKLQGFATQVRTRNSTGPRLRLTATR
jgi:hypothetical protein